MVDKREEEEKKNRKQKNKATTIPGQKAAQPPEATAQEKAEKKNEATMISRQEAAQPPEITAQEKAEKKNRKPGAGETDSADASEGNGSKRSLLLPERRPQSNADIHRAEKSTAFIRNERAYSPGETRTSAGEPSQEIPRLGLKARAVECLFRQLLTTVFEVVTSIFSILSEEVGLCVRRLCGIFWIPILVSIALLFLVCKVPFTSKIVTICNVNERSPLCSHSWAKSTFTFCPQIDRRSSDQARLIDDIRVVNEQWTFTVAAVDQTTMMPIALSRVSVDVSLFQYAVSDMGLKQQTELDDQITKIPQESRCRPRPLDRVRISSHWGV